MRLKPAHQSHYLLLHLLLLFSFFSVNCLGQEKQDQGVPKSINKKFKALEKSFSRHDKEEDIAQKYEDLAQSLFSSGDNIKAEEYQKKANAIYEKLNNKEKLSEGLRKLAKIQESGQKISDAISNYKKSGESRSSEDLTELNLQDVNRLENKDADKKKEAIDEKITILNKNTSIENKKTEILDAYLQKAQIEAKEEDVETAIGSYNKALGYTDNKSNTANVIKNEMADVMVANNQLNAGIELKKSVIKNADSINDLQQQIKYRNNLAHLYLKNQQDSKALELLQESYNLALQNNNTFAARNSLMQLIEYYSNKKDNAARISLYASFLNQLEQLIKADNSLHDSQLLETTEQKIKLLENEKNLKNELLEEQSSFNHYLIIALGLMLVLALVIARYYFLVRKRNKIISLQSLRREMNPHFLFNSLNSVNQFIAENKELEANKFLSSYSGLMRNMMENSGKDFIPLRTELEQLQKYLELEHLRFVDKFDFEITIDEQLDVDEWMIPNMLIQPHLENAIWHGLRYKSEKGKLLLNLSLRNQHLLVCITDDGIGIARSQALKTANQKIHQSIGINNINERIQLLNSIYQVHIRCEITDLSTNGGTKVELIFPLLTKNHDVITKNKEHYH